MIMTGKRDTKQNTAGYIMKKYLFYAFTLIFFSGSAIVNASPEKYSDNVVTITVTSQGYDYNSPWQKLSFNKEVVTGTVIEGNRILTLSYKLADHVLLEVSKFGASRKYPAKAVLKDYQSGLAVIEVADNDFFKDLSPVKYNTGGSIRSGKALIVKWDNRGIFKKHTAEYSKSAIEFFESSGVILTHHLMSDIESGGKGEPVFVGGRLAGITSWYLSKEKTVKVIDLSLILRMLRDLSDNKYEGMPYFYIEDAALGNDENLRGFLGLNEQDTGVLVIAVPGESSGGGVLKKNDVILSINGIDIDDNGLYQSQDYGKLNYYGLICLNNLCGDKVNMKIIRNKKKMDISFALKSFSDDSFFIPGISYDSPPEFYIIGGLVFQELTKEYLKTWGKDWPSKADKRLMYYFDNYARYPVQGERRIIILSSVLPASVNQGYHNYKNLILSKVNGEKIKDLKHVKDIIDKSKDKYIVLEFIGNYNVILNREDAERSIKGIMQKYNIHVPYYIGNK